MIHQQGTCRRLIVIRVELAAAARIRLENECGVAVEIADFADYSTDEFGGVWGEVWELLGSFGLLDLRSWVSRRG